MGFVIGILTFVMVVDSLALILLVLIQLPKKEAGAGLAFGGAATDALFGAGSGNVLTKITKYAAGIFFVLAVLLSYLQSHHYRSATNAFRNAIEQSANPMPGPAAPTTPAPRAPAPKAAVPPASSNLLILPPQLEATNAPVVPAKAPPAASTNK
ncbi:MAG TPA: preprotein translocase subunit SecG [Candidatus Acidoferrum sp.]|nr:preprotein translocase subunit SecG [Candidatus Acidoferrum sp.]